MKLKVITIYLLCAISIIYGCTDNRSGDEYTDKYGHRTERYYELLESYFQYLHNKRYSDSLLNTTFRYMHSSKSDCKEKVYAALYAATEYLYIENMDSVAVLLDYLDSMQDIVSADHHVEGQVCKVAGFYEMKANRNFHKGIDLLINSYELTFQEGRNKVEIVMSLANIVEFFYIRSDISGIYYAEKAYEIAGNVDDKWSKYAASVCMAQMLSLSEEPGDALPYIEDARVLLEEGKWQMVSYAIPLVYATVCDINGDAGKADSLYAKALEYSEYGKGEPYNIALVCLKYGKFCEKHMDFQMAAELYENGMSAGGNLLLDELLMNMAKCNVRMGNEQKAIEWFEKYMEFQDKFLVENQDEEADRLISFYREKKQELEVESRELKVLAVRRKMMVVVLCLVVVLILFVFAVISDRKQRKMNRILVTRYQYYVRQEEENKAAKKGQTADGQIWEKIETMMREDRIYRQKGLSLETMAQYVGTNRTYLSKAINSFSGKNFISYIDGYRIREAVRIIETSGDSTPFKIIADNVGYSTDSVFYKAFMKEIGVSPGKYRAEIQYRQRQK